MEKHEPEDIPIYGLLIINHAYNEGKITFQEWFALSLQWAEKMIERYGEGTDYPSSSCYDIERDDESTGTA